LLLGQHEEEAVEELAFVEVGQIGNVDIFHRGDRGAVRATGVARTAYLRVKNNTVGGARKRPQRPAKFGASLCGEILPHKINELWQ
jgi:hypothetical protein